MSTIPHVLDETDREALVKLLDVVIAFKASVERYTDNLRDFDANLQRFEEDIRDRISQLDGTYIHEYGENLIRNSPWGRPDNLHE